MPKRFCIIRGCLLVSIGAALLLCGCGRPPRADADGFGGGDEAWNRIALSRGDLTTTLAELGDGRDLDSLCVPCSVNADHPACRSVGALDSGQRKEAADFIRGTVSPIQSLLTEDPRSLFTFFDHPWIISGIYSSARTPLGLDGDIEIYATDWLAMNSEAGEGLMFHELGHKVNDPMLSRPLADFDVLTSFSSVTGGKDLLTAAGMCVVGYRLTHLPYYETVLQDKPLAYWRLGETSGTVAKDITGNHLDGTYGSQVSLGQPGAIQYDPDTAVAFTAATSSTVTVSVPTLQTQSGTWVTVEFWMKSPGQSGSVAVGFDLTDILFDNGVFGFNTGDNDAYGIAQTGLTNRWVYVVAQFYNGNVQRNRLYIDGKLQTGLAQHGTPNFGFNVTRSFNISGWPSGAANRFVGQIDEVAIYNGQLSGDRIQAHFAAASTRYNQDQ